MNILIIHYNTPELTNALVQSINKYVLNCHIYIFDNSDKYPFVNLYENVTVFDNTKGLIINFDEWLKTFPNKSHTDNNYASDKHCKSVDICFDLIPDGFILLDSDVLLKKDISEIYDNNYICVGKIGLLNHKVLIPRVSPFLCYINVPMCKAHGVTYFNDKYNFMLHRHHPFNWYDTGCWFLLNCRKYSIKDIDYHDYIEHYGSGSWKNNNKENLIEWLKQHKNLYLQ